MDPARPGLSDKIIIYFQISPLEPPFLTSPQGAVCGSIAGSIAAAVTTPLDVLRTRQMLGAGPNTRGGSMLHELATVVAKDGIAALFRGVGPRTGWMALGGCIFFGAYEQSTALLRRLQDEP